MQFLLAGMLMVAHAQDEKSAFERSLDRDSGVRSGEVWVDIRGVRYRKFEIKNELYYVHFRSPTASVAEVYCEPPPGFEGEHLIDSETRYFSRPGGFVQAFHESCKNSPIDHKTTLKLNAAIGLVYPDGKGGSLRPGAH